MNKTEKYNEKTTKHIPEMRKGSKFEKEKDSVETGDRKAVVAGTRENTNTRILRKVTQMIKCEKQVALLRDLVIENKDDHFKIVQSLARIVVLARKYRDFIVPRVATSEFVELLMEVLADSTPHEQGVVTALLVCFSKVKDWITVSRLHSLVKITVHLLGSSCVETVKKNCLFILNSLVNTHKRTIFEMMQNNIIPVATSIMRNFHCCKEMFQQASCLLWQTVQHFQTEISWWDVEECFQIALEHMHSNDLMTQRICSCLIIVFLETFPKKITKLQYECFSTRHKDILISISTQPRPKENIQEDYDVLYLLCMRIIRETVHRYPSLLVQHRTLLQHLCELLDNPDFTIHRSTCDLVEIFLSTGNESIVDELVAEKVIQKIHSLLRANISRVLISVNGVWNDEYQQNRNTCLVDYLRILQTFITCASDDQLYGLLHGDVIYDLFTLLDLNTTPAVALETFKTLHALVKSDSKTIFNLCLKKIKFVKKKIQKKSPRNFPKKKKEKKTRTFFFGFFFFGFSKMDFSRQQDKSRDTLTTRYLFLFERIQECENQIKDAELQLLFECEDMNNLTCSSNMFKANLDMLAVTKNNYGKGQFVGPERFQTINEIFSVREHNLLQHLQSFERRLSSTKSRRDLLQNARFAIQKHLELLKSWKNELEDEIRKVDPKLCEDLKQRHPIGPPGPQTGLSLLAGMVSTANQPTMCEKTKSPTTNREGQFPTLPHVSTSSLVDSPQCAHAQSPQSILFGSQLPRLHHIPSPPLPLPPSYVTRTIQMPVFGVSGEKNSQPDNTFVGEICSYSKTNIPAETFEAGGFRLKNIKMKDAVEYCKKGLPISQITEGDFGYFILFKVVTSCLLTRTEKEFFKNYQIVRVCIMEFQECEKNKSMNQASSDSAAASDNSDRPSCTSKCSKCSTFCAYPFMCGINRTTGAKKTMLFTHCLRKYFTAPSSLTQDDVTNIPECRLAFKHIWPISEYAIIADIRADRPFHNYVPQFYDKNGTQSNTSRSIMRCIRTPTPWTSEEQFITNIHDPKVPKRYYNEKFIILRRNIIHAMKFKHKPSHTSAFKPVSKNSPKRTREDSDEETEKKKPKQSK